MFVIVVVILVLNIEGIIFFLLRFEVLINEAIVLVVFKYIVEVRVVV